jgi:hypothetical protein
MSCNVAKVNLVPLCLFDRVHKKKCALKPGANKKPTIMRVKPASEIKILEAMYSQQCKTNMNNNRHINKTPITFH